MIDTGIYTLLKNTAGISSLVGTRVYAGYAPQNPTFPFIVYRRVSAFGRNLVHSGVSGVAKGRFQIDAYATTPLAAKTLAQQIRIAVHGYSGTVGGEEILRAESVNEIDAYDLNLGALVSLDFEITYRET